MKFSGIGSELTEQIIGAAIEVHREFGCGLKEEAYEAALCWELKQRGLKVERQVPCPVVYKGVVLSENDEHPKRIDLLVEGQVVVELKALSRNDPVFAAQCLTYLKMKKLEVGLVLNFGFPTLKEGVRHVINSISRPSQISANFPQKSPRLPTSVISVLSDSTPVCRRGGEAYGVQRGEIGEAEARSSVSGAPSPKQPPCLPTSVISVLSDSNPVCRREREACGAERGEIGEAETRSSVSGAPSPKQTPCLPPSAPSVLSDSNSDGQEDAYGVQR